MEDFDTLRREATKLERHLEDRVSRYQQVRGFYVEADLKNVYHSSSQYYITTMHMHMHILTLLTPRLFSFLSMHISILYSWHKN